MKRSVQPGGCTSTGARPGTRQPGTRPICAAELFLEHRLFRSMSTGQVINRRWLDLHYPPYWHYDTLHALMILSERRFWGGIKRATSPGFRASLRGMKNPYQRFHDGRASERIKDVLKHVILSDDLVRKNFHDLA